MSKRTNTKFVFSVSISIPNSVFTLKQLKEMVSTGLKQEIKIELEKIREYILPASVDQLRETLLSGIVVQLIAENVTYYNKVPK
jgi:hypothetical protein